MKNQKISWAVIPGVIAATAIVLSVSRPISLDKVLGFGTVLALVAIATLEYRIDWRRLFGR